MSENDKIIEGHDYDGIQELNNPLPRWWLITFYLTIVFAIFYYGYYEVLGGPSSKEELRVAMEKVEALQQQAAEAEPQTVVSDDSVAGILANAQMMSDAKSQYEGKCAACHGMKGEGTVGPNLTDKYWLHSKGDIEGIVTALRKGFPEKGMPPWEDMIPKDLHVAIAVYIQQLPPASGKGPQGEMIE